MKMLEHDLVINQEDNYLNFTYGESKVVLNIDNYKLLDAVNIALKDLELENKDNIRVEGIENFNEVLQLQNKELRALVDYYCSLVERVNEVAQNYKTLYEYYLKKYNEHIVTGKQIGRAHV